MYVAHKAHALLKQKSLHLLHASFPFFFFVSALRFRFKGQELAWVIVGSHNLSAAAWGKGLQKDKHGTLFIRSYGEQFSSSMEVLNNEK